MPAFPILPPGFTSFSIPPFYQSLEYLIRIRVAATFLKGILKRPLSLRPTGPPLHRASLLRILFASIIERP